MTVLAASFGIFTLAALAFLCWRGGGGSEIKETDSRVSVLVEARDPFAAALTVEESLSDCPRWSRDACRFRFVSSAAANESTGSDILLHVRVNHRWLRGLVAISAPPAFGAFDFTVSAHPSSAFKSFDASFRRRLRKEEKLNLPDDQRTRQLAAAILDECPTASGREK